MYRVEAKCAVGMAGNNQRTLGPEGYDRLECSVPRRTGGAILRNVSPTMTVMPSRRTTKTASGGDAGQVFRFTPGMVQRRRRDHSDGPADRVAGRSPAAMFQPGDPLSELRSPSISGHGQPRARDVGSSRLARIRRLHQPHAPHESTRPDRHRRMSQSVERRI